MLMRFINVAVCSSFLIAVIFYYLSTKLIYHSTVDRHLERYFQPSTCEYIYIYIYTHTRTYIYKDTHTYIYKDTHTHTHIYISFDRPRYSFLLGTYLGVKFLSH